MRRSNFLKIFIALLFVTVGSYLVPIAPAATVGPVTDPIGVVKIGKGEPIVIAWWFVVEGPDASLGIDTKRGVEIAVDDVGGKLLGHPIKLIGENSGCNAEGGVTAATKIAANKQVVAAIGSNCSSEAVPGAPILWKVGIPTVSPSNTAPILTDPKRGPGYDGYLRTAHNDKVQGRVAAEFARKILKANKAATIHDGSPYAEQLAAVFAENFEKLGGKIVAREAISPTDTDMRPVLTRISLGVPDIIYYPIFIAAGGHVTRQAKEIGGLKNTALMGADGMFSPDFLRAAGPAALGMYHTSPDLSPEALGPRYVEFLKKHEKKYGEKPLAPFHAHAYDAAMMIFEAIKKVAKTDAAGNLYIGRKALRDALYATKNFKGLTGTLTCNQWGDCADPKIAVYQVVNTDPKTWNPGVNPKKIWTPYVKR